MPAIFRAEYFGPECAQRMLFPPCADICVLHAYTENIRNHEEYLLRHLLDSEREKSTAFVHFEDRLAFIGAHALVRICCDNGSTTSPENLVLRYMASGKPFLVSSATGQSMKISLSHCRAAVAAAFSRRGDIGVDIEQTNWFADYIELARAYFHPEEAESCRAASPEAGILEFFTCWTKKEAFVKATGEGLSRELKSFLVPRGQQGPVRLADGALFNPPWLVESFRLEKDVLLAVAYKDKSARHSGQPRDGE